MRYFASVREVLGMDVEQVDTHAATVRQLRAELAERQVHAAQALSPQRAVRVAVDYTMADDDTVLSEGCEVAFFPPVTGG